MLPVYEARGYEHPVDVHRGVPDHPEINLLTSRSLDFGLSSDQKRIIGETLSSHGTPYLDTLKPGYCEDEVDRAIGSMTLMSVQGFQFRDSHEQMALGQLGVDIADTNSEYFRLAGNPERLRDFVVWFDKLARDSIAKQIRDAQDKKPEYIQRSGFWPILNVEKTKGIGVELGSVVMGGRWGYDKGLWEVVDPLPDVIRGIEGYGIEGPADEVASPSYKLAIAGRDFLKIERERGIWDIITPDGKRMYVAHRMVGMVAINHLGDMKMRSGARHGFSNNTFSEDVLMGLGAIFERGIATQGVKFEGVLPESSTVILRYPYKK